jgi:hypothetical protein
MSEQHPQYAHYRAEAQQGEALCKFKGIFSHDQKLQLLEILEQKMVDYPTKTRKRAFLVALEMMENALRHGMQEEEMAVEIHFYKDEIYTWVGNWTDFQVQGRRNRKGTFFNTINHSNKIASESIKYFWRQAVSFSNANGRQHNPAGFLYISRFLQHPITYKVDSQEATKHWVEVLTVLG